MGLYNLRLEIINWSYKNYRQSLIILTYKYCAEFLVIIIIDIFNLFFLNSDLSLYRFGCGYDDDFGAKKLDFVSCELINLWLN